MPDPILQAVKLGPDSPGGRFSRRVKGLLMPWNGEASGVVTYRVIERAPSPKPSQDERRAQARRRMRLRSGKVLARDNGFIVECLIRERSAKGARLQLGRPIAVPDRIGFFDDDERSIRAAEVVWQRRHLIGIRFRPELDPRHVKESELASLSRPFYAVEG